MVALRPLHLLLTAASLPVAAGFASPRPAAAISPRGMTGYDALQLRASSAARILVDDGRRRTIRPALRLEESPNSSEMVLASDGDRLLAAAFSNLSDKDKYDTVLSGLCASVVDAGPGAAASSEGLGDAFRLMEEMNAKRIAAGPRGIIGLVDAAALSSDARVMARMLSLAVKNGAVRRYGSLQGDITPFPRASSAAFGRSDPSRRRPEDLPPVPDDDRAAEVSQALLFAGACGGCVVINALAGPLGLEDLTFWTNLFLGTAIAVVVVDNFFDVLVAGGTAAARMNAEKLPDAVRNLEAPRKEEMAFGLGTGALSGSVVRGLGRLLSDNTERDCLCEAAAVFAAYGLGLPVFAFQPNALEGAALVIESVAPQGDGDDFNLKGPLDSLASDAGLLKVLIWLMAPVAAELSKYPVLMSSEPREALGLLQRLADKSRSDARLAQYLDGALPETDEERDACLRWALAEADLLLRNNRGAVEALSEALAGGAATVGDCVACVEQW